MKLIIARASISAVFAVVLTFFSVPTYADCFTDGYNAGQAACGTACNCQADYDRGYNDGKNSVTVPNCQVGDYDRGYTAGINSVTVPNCQAGDYDRGFNAGKAQCQICPSLPNCNEGDYQRGLTAGQAQCQACPPLPNCQEGDYDRGYTAGKNSVTVPDCQSNYNQGYQDGNSQGITEGQQQCKNNPEKCGLVKSDAITQAGIDEGKRQCQENPSKYIFATPNENTKAAIKDYCSKDAELCGILKTRLDEIINLINLCGEPNDNNPLGDCKKITLVTQQGKDAGKNDCWKNPPSCFTSPTKVEGSIPDTYCDNKTKNCASFPHGKLYLPTVDYITDANDVDNKTIHYKELKMDLLLGESSVVLVLKDYKQIDNLMRLKIEFEKTGNGEGEVVSYPQGIACGEDCEEDYEKDVSVELFAVPQDSNSVFTGWSGSNGCKDKTDNHITVKMNANKTCTATFEAVQVVPQQHTLTIATNAGTGTGNVTSEPAGINCGNDCTDGYDSGTTVKLTAAAEDGSTFKGWSGSGGSGCNGRSNNSITVTMNADKTCTAKFDLIE
jgi:hypothetical protein